MTLARRPLPGTDLELSVIALGTVPIGGDLSEDDSFRLLDAYAEMGGNFLDTAEIYSDWLDAGKSVSEQRIGKWLRARRMERQVVVATKGGHPRWGSLDRMRLAPEEIRSDLAASLDRLGLDSIPLYYLHRDDPTRPVDETMHTLARAVGDGLVRWIGCSNWTAERIAAAQACALRDGLPGFVIDQMRWSLGRVNAESQRIPGLVEMNATLHDFHRRTGMAAAAYSSQAQGFFSGAYGRGVGHPRTRAGEKVKQYYYSEDNFARLERVERLARDLGRPPTHVALAWLLNQPFPVFPIIGCSTIEHLRESTAAHDLELSDAQVRWLEAGH